MTSQIKVHHQTHRIHDRRVEGSTGRRDRWICPGGGKLYPSDDPVSGQHDDLRDRRDQPVLYGHRCEDDRMHTADRGEGLKA